MTSPSPARTALTTLALLASIPANVRAQEPARPLADRPANLEIRGEPLLQALRTLQLRSGVPIGFSEDDVPETRVVDCACTEVSVAEALNRLLEATGLKFVERRSQILVIPGSPEGPDAGSAGFVDVFGIVRERGPGTPIRSARIELRELRRATISDTAGRFTFPATPPGTYHVDVDGLGYRSVGTSTLTVGGEPIVPLLIELTPNPLSLAEVVVAPGTFGMLEEVALRPQTLTRAEMEALPQLGEDVFRTLERMPGVATDDVSAKLSIRGGNTDELLIMLDGTELFEPYHMKDLDSVLGVVDVATLRGASLVAGGLPTEHGGRMAGLLDMRTRQPIGSGTRHSLGFSITNFTFRTQGSFGDDRGGYFFSGRRGFLDLLLKMADATEPEGTNDELSPRYFDVMGKLEFLPAPDHRVSVHALYAGDDLDLEVIEPPDERASLGTDWTNLNVWSGWDWSVSPGLDVSTVLSASDISRRRTGDHISPGSSEVADFAVVDDGADAHFLTARQDWRWALDDGVVLKLGGQFRRAAADYRYSNEAGRELLDPDGSIGVEYDTTLVKLAPTATESGAYVAARVQPVERLTLEIGARYDHRTHTSDSDVSPRVQASLGVGESTTLRASVGAYRQSHGVEELSVVDGDTLFFPSELAKQFAVGLEHDFGSRLDARLEVYQRTTSDPRPRYINVGRVIIPFPEIGNDRLRFLPEEGRARGVEVILSGAFGSRADWSATYVLAEAVDLLDDVWIPRTLDQRHTVGLRWHFEPNPKWTLSAGWQFHSGWPSTPMEFQVDTIPDPGERTLLISESPGPINSARLPNYHRLDLRATRTFDVGRGRLNVFLDVFNLYNRRNLRSYDYKVELPSGRVIPNIGETLLPLLPSFGLTWEF